VDIRKYRGRVFGGSRFARRRVREGVEEEVEEEGYRKGSVGLLLLAGGIENFVKRGRRRVSEFLERREERGGEEMYLPSSLGSNRPSEGN